MNVGELIRDRLETANSAPFDQLPEQFLNLCTRLDQRNLALLSDLIDATFPPPGAFMARGQIALLLQSMQCRVKRPGAQLVAITP